MFLKSDVRGFTLLEFLFSIFLLAVLTATAMFFIRHQSLGGVTGKTLSEMDYVAHSILTTISREIRGGDYPLGFVDGGLGVREGGDGCDPALAEKDGTDCITVRSTPYQGGDGIKKSFFVQESILKMRDSDKQRTQSLTSDESGALIEDFQIGFLMSREKDFQPRLESGGTVEAVKVSIVLKMQGFEEGLSGTRSYSAVVNPRNRR